MNSNFFKFCSGPELNNLLITSGLLQSSWKAISDTRSDLSLSTTRAVEIKSYELPGGVEVIAFVPSADFTAQYLEEVGNELVPSEALKDEFGFISTKRNTSFSIHKLAVDLFKSVHDQLSDLITKQIKNSKLLIVSGLSIGGSIATLFTLLLQHNIDLELQKEVKPGEKKPTQYRPLCVNYGSPLFGNDGFQKAILERPHWVSSFLNVYSIHDPIPRLFSSKHNNVYKPFGTYVFCSDSGGCASFEDHESISILMQALSLDTIGNVQSEDYGRLLECLEKKALFEGHPGLDRFDLNPLSAGIASQLHSIGVDAFVQMDNGRDTILSAIEKRQKIALQSKRGYEPAIKLNDSKKSMACMELYKKACLSEGGYYDSYKNHPNDETQLEIIKRQRMLRQYWSNFVDEKDKIPQTEGASLRKRWLYAGNNYRRIVEPLDIAEYYHKEHKTDYINKGRFEHYKLLEKWMNEDKKYVEPRKKASSLTEDSCFWAHVEEANISCKVLKDAQSSPDDKTSSEKRLEEFEEYVMNLIKSFSVSKEIFLEQSSFMKWWKDYKEIKGTTYRSPLAEYMRNGYQSYA